MICSNSCLFRFPMITSGSGIGASFGFHQSSLPLVASSHSDISASFGFHQSSLLSVASSRHGIGAFLWISSEPSSVYLRGTFRCYLFCLNFVSTSVLVANCTFLHKLLMLNISFGCCRHGSFFHLFSWLKDIRPGINPRSFQQKKPQVTNRKHKSDNVAEKERKVLTHLSH